MSTFHKINLINRLKDEVADLKLENKRMSMRVCGMIQQMAQNRVAAKNTIEERDAEIADLKEESSTHDMCKEELNDLIDAREAEIEDLKKQCDEQEKYTEQVIKQSNDIEDTLNMKNGELQAQVEMLSESSQYKDAEITKKNETIYYLYNQLQEKNAEITKKDEAFKSMYNKFIEIEEMYKDMKAKFEHSTKMLDEIGAASSHINKILTFKLN